MAEHRIFHSFNSDLFKGIGVVDRDTLRYLNSRIMSDIRFQILFIRETVKQQQTFGNGLGRQIMAFDNTFFDMLFWWDFVSFLILVVVNKNKR